MITPTSRFRIKKANAGKENNFVFANRKTNKEPQIFDFGILQQCWMDGNKEIWKEIEVVE